MHCTLLGLDGRGSFQRRSFGPLRARRRRPRWGGLSLFRSRAVEPGRWLSVRACYLEAHLRVMPSVLGLASST